MMQLAKSWLPTLAIYALGAIPPVVFVLLLSAR